MQPRQAINHLLQGKDLSLEEAREVMTTIMTGSVTDVQIAGILMALRAKGETVDEIAGFVTAMRDKALRVDTKRNDPVDTCGTGGDGAQTFNISTAAALVAAGAGVTIAKHGNRALSSKCGSSDVLEALGIPMVAPDRVADVIDRIGIGFMFAPSHHPATRHAATARKELGVRTVFNLLGPMTNPAMVKRQLIGVFDASLTETVARVLATLGARKVYVVHGHDGSDEVSVVADTRVTALNDGRVETFDFSPESVGLSKCAPAEIAGGEPEENAAIIEAVLEGEIGPRRDVVILNAGFVVSAAGISDTIQEGIELAAAAIDNGRARAVLESLRRVSAEINANREQEK